MMTPIHFEEGERILLAIMTQEQRQIDIARDSLPLEAFYIGHNRIGHNRMIYQILLNRRAKDLPCDMLAIFQALKETDLLNQFGENGSELLFLGEFASVLHWDYMVAQVMARFHARNVITAANEIAESAACSPELLSETVERLLPALTTNQGKSGMKSLKDLLFEATDRWENRRSRGTYFGIPPLDRSTGGAFPGEVTIICGQAKSGKTSLAMQLAANMANDGNGVAVFSLEMSDAELVDRMVSNQGGIALQKFRTQDYSAQDFLRMKDSIGEMSAWPVWISQGAVTMSAIHADCRRLKARHGLFLVLVDYIQLVEGPRAKGESREQQVSAISRALKRLAMELGVHVIALSQLNDEGKLRESRAIGQDANLVLFVEPAKQPTDRILRIALQRNGPAGIEIPITFRGDCVRFEL